MPDGQSFPKRRSYKPADLDLKVKRASAGLGLFAGEPITIGTCVIEYVGHMLNNEEYAKSNSVYLFDIGRTGALDGSPRWNKARYINHSCKPNCEATVRKRRVFIHAIRDIQPGEELSYDYGKEYFDELIGDRCRCPKCQTKQARKLIRAAG